MSGVEGGSIPGEQQAKDPVEQARNAFNTALFGAEYTPQALLFRTLELQRALLKSQLSPEKMYHELRIVAGQGAERAALANDTVTVDALRELQKGFDLTYKTFNSQGRGLLPTSRTDTRAFPPMTSAKGAEAAKSQPVVAPEAPEPRRDRPQDEATVGAILRKKRDAKGLSQAALGKKVGYIKQLLVILSGEEFQTRNNLPN